MDLKLSKYAFQTTLTRGYDKKLCLFFSGRKAKMIVVSERIKDYIDSCQFDKLPVDIRDILISNKVLVPTSENELFEVNKENEEAFYNEKRDRLYISVQATAYCQLACDYCGQEHSRNFLDDDKIDLIVDRIRMKLRSFSYKILETGWFGGEPLLALKQMRKLNFKLKQIAKDLNVSYIGHITTNGYSLTPSLYKELKNVFHIKRIEITLYGNAEYHNKRRFTLNKKGSFETIFGNLTCVVSSPEYNKENCIISVRCNVDERNVDGVLPLLRLFVEKGIQNDILFYATPVVSWSNNGAGGVLSKQLLGHKSSEYLTYMLKHGFNTEILPHRMKPYICIGTAPLGSSEMYDADGNIFDCSETS